MLLPAILLAVTTQGAQATSPAIPLLAEIPVILKKAEDALARGSSKEALLQLDSLGPEATYRVAFAGGSQSGGLAWARKIAVRSFLTWQTRMGQELRFEWVEKGPAEITLQFIGRTGILRSDQVGLTRWNRKPNEATPLPYRAEILVATMPKDAARVEHTILHEIGHALGLDHVDQPGMLMSNFDPNIPITEPTLAEVQAVRDWREKARALRAKAIL